MVNFLNTIAEHWFDLADRDAVADGGVDRASSGWWTCCIRKWAHPQVRYALWMLVLVKLLIPPTWTSPASVTSHIPGLPSRPQSRDSHGAGK